MTTYVLDNLAKPETVGKRIDYLNKRGFQLTGKETYMGLIFLKFENIMADAFKQNHCKFHIQS